MPYAAVTLAQLQVLLQEKWESVAFWDTTDATNYLNETLRIWNLLTAQWKTRVTINTVVDQVWYNVPSTLVYELRMDFSSYPMEISNLTDLDLAQPNWEGETTATTGVPSRPSYFAPAGLNLFGIWPADHAGGNTLVVDAVRQTPVLVNPGDFVDIGQEELQPLLGYALHVGAFKEGGSRFKSTQAYYQQFLNAAADKNSRLKSSTFFRKVMGLDRNRDARVLRVPVGAQNG